MASRTNVKPDTLTFLSKSASFFHRRTYVSYRRRSRLPVCINELIFFFKQPAGGSMSLSLVIIALNEENCIERCIRSVPFASEVLVVDSGSSDATAEIAQTCGARVLHHDFEDYSKQKRWAVQRSSGDWVLSLDADEYLNRELSGTVKRLLKGSPEHSGYRLPFRVLYMKRLMRFGPWMGETHLRLFRRNEVRIPEDTVHEGFTVPGGSTGKLREGYVVHEPYSSLFEQVDKLRKYGDIWAESQYQGGRGSGLVNLLFRPAWRFFAGYLLKAGFLEGFPGITASFMTSFYVYYKWARLRELTRPMEECGCRS
ncbi:MAG: glycosyltransferase [Candidatus Aegiribacteria sp.]|nr:glycosyltransferase [Candidatus Aegiribacteria sp.]MBD3294495.1 glycosyltransferase [Candidatus Fermentibacteria bacterium]